MFYTKSFGKRLLELTLKELILVRDNFNRYFVLTCYYSVEKEYKVFYCYTFFI